MSRNVAQPLSERGKKFLVDVNWSLLSLLMLTATAVVLRILLARWLEPAGFGVLNMMINLQGVSAIVAGFGIPMALTRYVARGERPGEESVPPSCALAGAALLGAVAGLSLQLLAEPIARLYRMPQLSGLIALLGWGLPFSCFTETLLGLFNGLRNMRSYACLVFVRSASMVLFSWTLVIAGYGVEGAVWGMVLSAGAGALYGGIAARRHLAGGLSRFFPAIRRLCRFGSRIFGSNAVSELVNRADVLLVGYFLSASQVGVYSSAASISALLLIIPSAIQKVSYPASSAYWAGNDQESLQSMVDKVMKYSACVLFPVGLGTLFFGREIIALVFGRAYLDGYLPLCILLVPRVLGGSTLVPVGSLFSGIGRPEVSLKIDSSICVLNLLLNVLLIPRFGIAGAAAALALAQLCGYGAALALLARIVRIRIDWKWFGMAAGGACAAIVFFLLARGHLGPHLLCLTLLSGYLIFVFSVLLSREDKRILGSVAHSIISR
ncbi:flippase [Geomonas sp. RF6]|uniref:flippase n=1 Tax=Geomonas sp. RF6 TaxID=2897342 RepID=UPI001E4F7D5B|nr:flippase [Geomonas sp. RF6]UFS69344.1 flippase [Geomonas sp. RF6]